MNFLYLKFLYLICLFDIISICNNAQIYTFKGY